MNNTKDTTDEISIECIKNTDEIENKIQIIMRQTDYSYEECRKQLKLYNNDINMVIKVYLNNGIILTNESTNTVSINQQIYKELRTFMSHTIEK